MIEEAMKKDGAAPAVGPPPVKNDGQNAAVDSAQGDTLQADKSNKKKKWSDLSKGVLDNF